jgi:hypothetical protein
MHDRVGTDEDCVPVPSQIQTAIETPVHENITTVTGSAVSLLFKRN